MKSHVYILSLYMEPNCIYLEPCLLYTSSKKICNIMKSHVNNQLYMESYCIIYPTDG